MVTLRIKADVPSNRQILITLPPDVPLGENELEIHIGSQQLKPRGVPGAAVRGIAAGASTPPDDETVKKWIEEHSKDRYR